MWKPWVIADGERPQWTTAPQMRLAGGLEAKIAWLAEQQHGVVALPQLVGAGLGPRGVRHRVASGALHRVHRGVYALGRPSLTERGHWMAAVLACGPGAVLSHRSAAALWELRPTTRASIDVTIPGRAGRRLGGIDAHRTRTLTGQDVAVVDSIPCTTVSRTLLDLADVVGSRAAERALDQAEVMRLFDLAALENVLDRAGGRRGAGTLRRLLASYAVGQSLTRRELEERFLRLCDRAGVGTPAVNAWVVLDGGEAFEVDFLWRAERVIAETDGWEFHRTRRAFERDRARDQRLVAAGHRVVRFTWRQVADRPQEVVDTLRSLLPRPGPERLGSVRVHAHRPP